MKNFNRENWLTFLSASFFSFFDLFQFSSFNVISSNLMTTLHLTTAGLGVLSAYYLWANSAGLIPIGIMLDKFSPRKIGLTFIIFSVIGCFGLSLSTSFGFSCVMRFLQGLASATSMLMSMRMATTLFDRYAPLMVGIIIAIAVSGGVAGNILFAYLINITGWRIGMALLGSLGLMIFIFMYNFFYPPAMISTATSVAVAFKNFTHALQKRNMLSGLYLGLINAPVFILASLWGNYFLSGALGLSNVQAANFSTLIFVGIIIGSPLWGWLAERFNKHWLIIYFGVISITVLSFVLAWVKMLSLFSVAILFLALGLACCTQNLIYPLIARSNVKHAVSTATGIACFISNIVGATSQIIFGKLVGLKNIGDASSIIFLTSEFLISLFVVYFYHLAYDRKKLLTDG